MFSLPHSVERMLERVQLEKSTEPADYGARRDLARIGEDQALEILGRISQAPAIKKSLSAFISYMVKKYCNEPRTPERRRPEPAYSQESVNFSAPSTVDFGGSRASTSGELSPNIASPRHTAIHVPPRVPPNPVPISISVPPSTPPPRDPPNPVPTAIHVPPITLPLGGPPNPMLITKHPEQLHDGVMQALGELEFRKAFLILSYAGRKKVNDIVSVDLIMKLKSLSMANFEQQLWEIVKNKGCIPASDRRKNLNWDCQKTYIYHCHIDSDGSILFKGPYLEDTSTHFHRVLGDDNVLMVKFSSGNDYSNHKFLYHRIAEEGIIMGLRRYRFFVFKDGGKEKSKDPASSSVKCYFVRTESKWVLDVNKPYILTNKSIQEARNIFMHVHTLPSVEKYMARFSLILSKTINLKLDFASVTVEQIEDIPCIDEDGRNVFDEDGNLMIHTDGTGFISEDLAYKCPRRIWKGRSITPREFQTFLDGLEATETLERHSGVGQSLDIEPPLLMQVRLFYDGTVVKGTLLVNKQLPLRTIQIRPSMLKVNRDPNFMLASHCNSLEVVGTSNLSKKSRLSKSIIMLLHYGGVPQEYFLELTRKAILDAKDAKLSRKSALGVASLHGNMDDFLVARMIACGIPLHEPYLEHQLSVMTRAEWNGLKAAKIPVNDCYYLMGTADPTGTLEPNEVCIILENGQVSGKVLVFKHPGLHFGDVHIVNAVYVKNMEKIVGNAKYAIFFPTKGQRSLADEMANSDYDGDLYWVSRNAQLIEHFKQSKPWSWTCSKPKESRPRRPIDFSSNDLERALFQKFLDSTFEQSYAMSEASDSWMAYMDRVLTECVPDMEKQRLHAKLLKLIDMYYLALDAPKKGST
ncbi:probable RNA-dependent RNA polymerase 4 isoform X2 [Asparagus officinalis]|nr:probable RNA-dependent RNA polymerase 4 isoform X2 [Asparagus officinalis]